MISFETSSLGITCTVGAPNIVNLQIKTDERERENPNYA